jgi:hypothetical protein
MLRKDSHTIPLSKVLRVSRGVVLRPLIFGKLLSVLEEYRKTRALLQQALLPPMTTISQANLLLIQTRSTFVETRSPVACERGLAMCVWKIRLLAWRCFLLSRTNSGRVPLREDKGCVRGVIHLASKEVIPVKESEQLIVTLLSEGGQREAGQPTGWLEGQSLGIWYVKMPQR